MRKPSFLINSLLIVLFLLISRISSEATDIVIQPVILLNDSDCVNLQKVVTEQKDAKKLFKPLKKLASKSLKRSPSAAAEINYEGLLQDDPMKMESNQNLEDMNILQTLAYAYAVTKDAKYGLKAKAYILAWVETYKPDGNPVNENLLTPIFSSYLLIDDQFTKEEKNLTESWIRSIARKEIELGKKNPAEMGSWKSKRLKIVGLAASMFNDLDLLEYTVNGVKEYIESNLFEDGASYDLQMRDALSYHCEGLAPLLSLLLIMPSNYDMFSYQNKAGGSVKKSVEFVLPYANGEEVYSQWQNSKVELDRVRWEHGDENYNPGSVWDPKSGLEFFVYAQFFDERYKDVIAKLSTGENQPFSTWECVVAKAKEMSN
ncbi:alginate lyase family protein [Sunxiuqinia sp. A32]|uniref:alginate lyase family protein n=1 Tax=Sunxiuqinia sp. A32 TaxID=3461496 RepID=UPI0040452492